VGADDAADGAGRETARIPAAQDGRAARQVERAAALGGEVMPAGRSGDPAVIEAEIERRREHLAATVDELLERARPKAIARRGVADARLRVRTATLTPEGGVRVERVGALAAAVVAFLLLGAALRRRRRRRG
jgi:hypothetical protein